MPHRCHRDELWLALIAAAVSIVAFLFYFRHNTLLLYGDAVAHINIARRVFDSRDPGPLQLGTVWLPLPHILMMPFVISRWMWRTGVGGAIPSMIAYVAGAVGLFRLVRRALESAGDTAGIARTFPWCAAGIYIANPNLIYLQTTAMTEPLYLALFIWATVFFSEFVHGVKSHPLSFAKNGRPPEGGGTRCQADAGRALRNCGLLLLLCMLTRYDGWFAGAVFGVAAAAVVKFSERKPQIRSASLRECGTPTTTTFGFRLLPLPRTRGPFRKFVLLLVAVPVLWLVYNAAVWGNPLEFANGPYSAKGIERRTATATMPHHPGYHSVKVATVFFLKDAKLNLADGRWQTAWLVIAAAGLVVVLLFARRLWPLLLLWVPLPFYALSISRAGVPIFIPSWWPYSYYNVRYGLQLLPAIAVSIAVVLCFVTQRARNMQWRAAAILAAVTFAGVSYVSVWQNSPICLREARMNSLTRVPFERKLAGELERLPATATVLMYVSDHVGALQQIGMPLSRTINETTHPYWKLALANPSQYAEYAMAFGEDAVALAVKSDGGFEAVATIESAGLPRTIIYRRKP